MKIVKLVVLLCIAMFVQCYRSGYCEICRNHTLCKYSVGGPTAECTNFDKNSLLSDKDIVEITNRINGRRNLVATGRLNRFPQAANMRKVRWSTELASFAQRWADQCEPSVRPNKEDDCRDLVDMQVGQSIAAVLGPAPGLNVKSFVDMWFMLKLHYTGSIVYYNGSRDDKTSYFTQLIWADTEYVGCGKVKFFNQKLNTVVERLVCNFAPKGNIHGKPVYALGYPATQCPQRMYPDQDFPGLCTQDNTAAEIVQSSSASRLLRILDLSNNSAKQELDPNNLKQTNFNSNEINYQRNQKTRHVFFNNSNGAIKRDSFHMQQNPLNPSDSDNFKGHQFTPERGHSRMYHGYQTKNERTQNYQSTQAFSEQDFRRYDLKTTTNPFSSHDHDYAPNNRRIMNSQQNDYSPNGRRVNNNLQNDYLPNGRRINNQNEFLPNAPLCTRKVKLDDCCPPACPANQCTRGQSHSCSSCLKAPPCDTCLPPPPPAPLLPPPLMPLPPLAVPSHGPCPCSSHQCAPLLSPCDLNMNCPACPSHNCPAPLCAKRRAQSESQEESKSTQFNYYDLFPNMRVRSGDDTSSQRKPLDNPEIEDDLESKTKESDIRNQVKETSGNVKTSFQKPQDLYGIFYSSERKRRDYEDQMTFKPFWQMDEYNYKKPSELKSLRYTTLGNKRNRKTRKNTSTKFPTESITIKLEGEIIHDDPRKDRITEKYLSFEELMRLRKLSTLEPLDYEARRLGDDALRAPTTTKKPVAAVATTKAAAAKTKAVAVTTKAAAVTTKPAVTTKVAATTKAAAATTEATTYSANTPFIRLKQCTRKLTCTWTAYMVTGPDGNAIWPHNIPGEAGGVGIDFGSRTPPGYVDGCTRTSTCTRDFMDRNKMATVSEDADSAAEPTTQEDEEYCEKRSLNVQRRNLDDTDKILSIEFREALTEITPSTPEINHVTNSGVVDTEIPQSKQGDCICYEDYSRVKREKMGMFEQLINKDCGGSKLNKNTKYLEMDTYDDVYSTMIRKISKFSKLSKNPHQCLCNRSKSVHNPIYWVVLVNYSFTTCFKLLRTNI